jgi:hypothetical protein
MKHWNHSHSLDIQGLGGCIDCRVFAASTDIVSLFRIHSKASRHGGGESAGERTDYQGSWTHARLLHIVNLVRECLVTGAPHMSLGRGAPRGTRVLRRRTRQFEIPLE